MDRKWGDDDQTLARNLGIVRVDGDPVGLPDQLERFVAAQWKVPLRGQATQPNSCRLVQFKPIPGPVADMSDSQEIFREQIRRYAEILSRHVKIPEYRSTRRREVCIDIEAMIPPQAKSIREIYKLYRQAKLSEESLGEHYFLNYESFRRLIKRYMSEMDADVNNP